MDNLVYFIQLKILLFHIIQIMYIYLANNNRIFLMNG